MMMNVEQLVESVLEGEKDVLGETCPSDILSTTKPTWPDLGSNPGCCRWKPTTNRLSYAMASGFFPSIQTNSGSIPDIRKKPPPLVSLVIHYLLISYLRIQPSDY
jgi:hypothetical protein